MKREQITHTELLDKIRYNSKTGIFYNRLTGQRIGHYDASNDTRAMLINGKKYQETRLAVFYVTGQWPKGFVKNRSACKTVTKYKDLIFKLPLNNVSVDNWLAGTSPQYKSGGPVMDDYHSKENFLKRFWRWLNG